MTNRQNKPTRLTRVAFLLFSGILFLAGCSVLNPGPPPARIQLFPDKPERSSLPPVNRQLVVEMPSSGRDIDTDAIALFFNEREVRYLGGYRWTDTAPALFRRALIDTLNASGSFTGVSNENAGITADARLVSDLKLFHLRYESEKLPPSAEIAVSVQLVNLRDGGVMASTLFSAKQKAADTSHNSLILAFEKALSDVLLKAAPWVEAHIREAEQTSKP